MKTQSEQPNNPLHGITLETMLNTLIDQYGWEGLYKKIAIKCFLNNPSIKSSLKFLRQSLWAREKVERLYLQLRRKQKKHHQPEPDKDVDS